MFVLLLSAAALQAATTPLAPPIPQTVTVVGDKPAKDRKICRDNESTTSRMARRICKTAGEWASQSAPSSNAGRSVLTATPKD